jgi:hypothetical protein
MSMVDRYTVITRLGERYTVPFDGYHAQELGLLDRARTLGWEEMRKPRPLHRDFALRLVNKWNGQANWSGAGLRTCYLLEL